MKKFNGEFVIGSEVITLDEALRLTDSVFFTHDSKYAYLGKRGDNIGAMSWIISAEDAMKIGVSCIDVKRLEKKLNETDLDEMILVYRSGYRWVSTDTRNGKKLVKGRNDNYFKDAIAFYIPKRTDLKTLNHRSLDWMTEHFS